MLCGDRGVRAAVAVFCPLAARVDVFAVLIRRPRVLDYCRPAVLRGTPRVPSSLAARSSLLAASCLATDSRALGSAQITDPVAPIINIA